MSKPRPDTFTAIAAGHDWRDLGAKLEPTEPPYQVGMGAAFIPSVLHRLRGRKPGAPT